jgi:hypothetical protein
MQHGCFHRNCGRSGGRPVSAPDQQIGDEHLHGCAEQPHKAESAKPHRVVSSR